MICQEKSWRTKAGRPSWLGGLADSWCVFFPVGCYGLTYSYIFLDDSYIYIYIYFYQELVTGRLKLLGKVIMVSHTHGIPGIISGKKYALLMCFKVSNFN